MYLAGCACYLKTEQGKRWKRTNSSQMPVRLSINRHICVFYACAYSYPRAHEGSCGNTPHSSTLAHDGTVTLVRNCPLQAKLAKSYRWYSGIGHRDRVSLRSAKVTFAATRNGFLFLRKTVFFPLLCYPFCPTRSGTPCVGKKVTTTGTIN